MELSFSSIISTALDGSVNANEPMQVGEQSQLILSSTTLS